MIPAISKTNWEHWRFNLPDKWTPGISTGVPKNWKKITHNANNIIEICPFCNTYDREPTERIGNLEHLDLYCKSST